MDFKLDHKMGDDLIIYPKGELDIYVTDSFKREVLKLYEENKTDLIMDCKDLDYLDSTGLGALIYILKELKKNDHKIKLKNLKESIKKLFTITKLDDIFEM